MEKIAVDRGAAGPMVAGEEGCGCAPFPLRELRCESAEVFRPVGRESGQGRHLGVVERLQNAGEIFERRRLVAPRCERVRALGRRSGAALPPMLESGDIILDSGRRVALRAGRRLDLSPKEFALLECLLASAGRVVSAEELLERVWDEQADPFTTAVKTTVRRLRAKLGEPPVIRTVREGGYQIGAA